MIPSDLRPGDSIDVFWADPCMDETGDPTTATMASLNTAQPFRISGGRFWCRKVDRIVGKKGVLEIPVLLITFTWDNDNPHQQGYRVIPEHLIADVKIIARMRRPRAKKVKVDEAPT